MLQPVRNSVQTANYMRIFNDIITKFMYLRWSNVFPFHSRPFLLQLLFVSPPLNSCIVFGIFSYSQLKCSNTEKGTGLTCILLLWPICSNDLRQNAAKLLRFFGHNFCSITHFGMVMKGWNAVETMVNIHTYYESTDNFSGLFFKVWPKTNNFHLSKCRRSPDELGKFSYLGKIDYGSQFQMIMLLWQGCRQTGGKCFYVTTKGLSYELK